MKSHRITEYPKKGTNKLEKKEAANELAKKKSEVKLILPLRTGSRKESARKWKWKYKNEIVAKRLMAFRKMMEKLMDRRWSYNITAKYNNSNRTAW